MENNGTSSIIEINGGEYPPNEDIIETLNAYGALENTTQQTTVKTKVF